MASIHLEQAATARGTSLSATRQADWCRGPSTAAVGCARQLFIKDWRRDDGGVEMMGASIEKIYLCLYRLCWRLHLCRFVSPSSAERQTATASCRNHGRSCAGPGIAITKKKSTRSHSRAARRLHVDKSTLSLWDWAENQGQICKNQGSNLYSYFPWFSMGASCHWDVPKPCASQNWSSLHVNCCRWNSGRGSWRMPELAASRCISTWLMRCTCFLRMQAPLSVCDIGWFPLPGLGNMSIEFIWHVSINGLLLWFHNQTISMLSFSYTMFKQWDELTRAVASWMFLDVSTIDHCNELWQGLLMPISFDCEWHRTWSRRRVCNDIRICPKVEDTQDNHG